MATTKSAEKRHKQSLRNKTRNRIAKSAIRTTMKSALEAAKSGDKEAAKKLTTKAVSLLDKAAVHGLVHKNNAKRRISRFVKAISSAQPSA